MSNLPAPPPARPDRKAEVNASAAEYNADGLLIEARLQILVIVDADGTRDAILVIPEGQGSDLVTMLGALERVKFLLETQYRKGE